MYYAVYERVEATLPLGVWSDDATLKAAAKKLYSPADKAPSAKAARRRFLAAMVRYHHAQQKLCRRFAL